MNKGANIGAQDKCGNTALHIAIENGDIEIVEMLLNAGANVYVRDNLGRAVLHFAVKNGNIEIVKVLLNAGANLGVQDKCGKTVLHFAVENDKIEIVKVRLNAGANVYVQDDFGNTVLHSAVETGFPVIVEHVLKHCPDVNSINSKDVIGRTALHIACKEGHKQIVIALVAHGSDINIMCDDNETPLDFANDFEIVDILKRHVVKMKIANLFVSKKNLLSISNNDEIGDFQNGCEEEIARMKSEKVGNANVSFYDILTKDVSQIAMYAGNDSIAQILRSDDYKIKFPIYATMINSNFRKGERVDGRQLSSLRLAHLKEIPMLWIEKMEKF